MSRFLGYLFGAARLAHRLGLQSTAFYRLPADWIKRRLYQRDHGLPPHRIFLQEGLRLHIPYTLTHDYFLNPFEIETTNLVKSLLTSGQVFVDVGANVGYFTLLAAKQVGGKGQVYAVEPSQENLVFLRHNVEHNALNQVRVIPAAAGARKRTRTFFQGPIGVLHGFYNDQIDRENRCSVEVRELPLDEMIDGIADVVKIDVEGAELEVLEGMDRLISGCPGLHLIVEWNPSALRRAGVSPGSLAEHLSEAGFLLRLLDVPRGSPRTVEEISAQIESDELPPSWVANLHARPKRS